LQFALTSLWIERKKVSIPDKGKTVSLIQSVHPQWVHPASHAIGTADAFPWGKAAAAWCIPSLPGVKVNNSCRYVLTPPDEFVAFCLTNHTTKLSWKKGIFRSKDERIW